MAECHMIGQINNKGSAHVRLHVKITGHRTNKQTNKLYLTRVTLNSEITDKPVALGFQIELDKAQTRVADELKFISGDE